MRLLRARLIVISIVVICVGGLRLLFIQPFLVMGAIGEMRQAISQTISDPIEDPDSDMIVQVQDVAQSVIMDHSEHWFVFNLGLDGAILLVVILSMLPARPAKPVHPAPDPTTQED
jgi:uncharacterized membrane protein